MTARIWIGGQLWRSVSHELVLAVQKSSVSTGDAGYEHILCKPDSIEGLLEARLPDGRLHLQYPEDLGAPVASTYAFRSERRAS